MKRAFASLSPQEALQVAISIEDRNAEIYRNFADLFAEFADLDSMEISLAFREMSMEERHHSARLQKSYFERYGTRKCEITEDEIADLIEVPSLHSADVFGTQEVSHPGRQRALSVALAAERSALDFYRRLVETTGDSAMRHFYQNFVEMESQHAYWLQTRMAQAHRKAG